ncbi:hypothetical protein ACQJBY_011522 [Aegilops geniculata]
MEVEGMEFLLDAVDRFPVREEFADSLDNPDPVPLIYLLEKGSAANDMGEVNGVAEQTEMEDVGAAAATQQGGRSLRAESPTRSAQSAGRVNPQAPGWTKRLRLGSAPHDRVPCPLRMSALEISIRKYAEQPDKSVVKPELGLSFDSLGEAYDFYNLYSWEIGFGITYGKSRLNAERTKTMQEIVCGCSGKPETENSRSCRCECPALIRLLRASDNSWYITEHRASHNHSMSLTMGEKVHWPSHKHIDVYTKDLIKQLRENNVNLGKVYSIIGSFFGSVDKVPFTKRTLRNICGKISREQAEDDVRKTLQARLMPFRSVAPLSVPRRVRTVPSALMHLWQDKQKIGIRSENT